MSSIKISPKNVLLIDDDEVVLTLMEQYLLSLGHKFQALTSGNKAVEVATNMQADIIFVDLIMPGYSGFDVLKSLKMTPDTKELPVVMMTANPRTSSMTAIYGIEPDHFLNKPFDFAALTTLFKDIFTS
jgi:twitching motility two-component system response regulator PilH